MTCVFTERGSQTQMCRQHMSDENERKIKGIKKLPTSQGMPEGSRHRATLCSVSFPYVSVYSQSQSGPLKIHILKS